MSTTRRRFIQIAGASAALGFAGLEAAARPQPPVPEASGHSSFDPWLEIRPDHLRHNLAEVRRRIDGRPVMAVIKNNGYGLGVVEVGRALEGEAGVAALAVVKLNEAVRLRDAGIRKPVLLMGPFDEQNLMEMVRRDIMPMVYTPIGEALDRASAEVGRPIPIHVCVDTGLGRVGVPHQEAAALIRDLGSRRSVAIQGLMTTLSEDAELDRQQLERLRSIRETLGRDGLDVGSLHAASSFALFQHPDSFLDMARTGMVLYGVYPELPFRDTGVLELRPAVALRSRVAYVKRLPKGGTAGYNRAYVAPRDIWIATLPVGHADGWPREAAKGARVRINGALYPVIASISASHTIVEIGDDPAVRIGDTATLFDWEPGSRPEDVSAACGASVYDLLMHLGAHLPRRVL